MIALRMIIMALLPMCFLSTGDTLAATSFDTYMDSAKASALVQAQAHIFNDRYAAADSIYLEFIRQNPADPAGPLFRAAGMMAEMSDREEQLYSDSFHTLLDSATALCDRTLDSCDDRTAAWMYLLRGHAKAYESLWESRFGSMFTAVRTGMATDNEYSAGFERDSSLYDLYAGLGSYHYWKSAKAGVLRWIGIFRNEKDKGIDELRLAADSSLMHREAAASALIWIWLDSKQYDSTIVAAREFAERYPDGKTFLWPIAQAWYKQEMYDSALVVYHSIRDKLIEEPGNYFNVIECDYYITKCLTWLKKDEDAISAASAVHDYRVDIPDQTLKRQRSKVRYLENVADR